jgi:Uma2 family endonuclease
VSPTVVIEVLSATTETRDRLEKRLGYQRLASLREYVLVAQERRAIEVFRRRADGWEVETCGNQETLRLASLAFATPVGDPAAMSRRKRRNDARNCDTSSV